MRRGNTFTLRFHALSNGVLPAALRRMVFTGPYTVGRVGVGVGVGVVGGMGQPPATITVAATYTHQGPTPPVQGVDWGLEGVQHRLHGE